MKLNLNISVSDLSHCKGDVSLPPNETYSLVINYPLSTPYTVKIKSGPEGMGLAPLLGRIGKAYEHVYANANKYGIWGHDMGDLVLESINVNTSAKTITISVGS